MFDISSIGCDLQHKGGQSLCDIFPLGVYSRQGRVEDMCLISLPLGAFFQEGRTSFEASGFLIWDIYPFSIFTNALRVLFPGGANFF